MKHPIYRVTSVSLVGPFTLRVSFDDNTSRTIDFSPMLRGEVYGPLRDPRVFQQVALDPEVHTIVWPNGADFDPATLHDWPDNQETVTSAAERWRKSHKPASQ